MILGPLYRKIHEFRTITAIVAAALVFCAIIPKAWAQEEDEGGEILKAPVEVSDSGLYHGLSKLPESIRKSAIFGRSYHELYRLAGPSGQWDKDAYLKAVEKAKLDIQNSSGISMKGANSKHILSGSWTNVGLMGTGAGVYSAGCTSAIAFDPTQPSTMYAAAINGGLWKSFDAGESWTPLTDNVLPNLTVATIAVDPTDPQTVYIGTGDCNYGYPSYSGTGVYKSVDGGGSWNRLTIGGVNSVVKVLVDPVDHNIVFADSYNDGVSGVFRSTNGGTNWTKVYAAKGVAWDIIATVSGGQSTYFMVDGANPSGGTGFFKSTDGITWTKLTDATLPTTATGRTMLASPKNAPDHIFALVATSSGDLQGMYKSVNAGDSWETLDAPADLFSLPNSGGFQGWYDLYIGVTPNSVDHDTIYAAGIQAYVNYDDGQGWQIFSGYSDAVKSSGPHVDHHSIGFNPQNSSIVYEGNDGGLYWSKQAGKAGTWEYRSSQMITNRFYHIAFDRANPNVTWAGAQDQGTWRQQAGQDAASYFGGDGMQPLVSPQNSLTVFAENPNGQAYRTSNYKTGTWTDITGSLTDSGPWDSPFKINMLPHGTTPAGSIVWIGRASLYRSTNAGTQWTKVTGTLGSGVTAIGLSPYNSDVAMVAGGSTGTFEVSTNFGTTFTSKKALGSEVSSIQLTGADTNFVLVSVRRASAPVSISHDRGTTWIIVSGSGANSLPAVNCESVALDSVNPLTTWYAATDIGMYYTTDAGQNWYVMASGLGLMSCREVALNPNKSTLRVATFGRGIWEADINHLDVEMNTLAATKATDGTHLSWTTFGEESGTTFYVERSLNGDTFEKIATVTGMGSTANSHDYSFVDSKKDAGTYLFQIHAVDADGTEHYSNHVELHYGLDQMITYQSFPNPFVVSAVGNSTSTLRYELPGRDNVTISIFSSTGKPVRTLQSNSPENAGSTDAEWDGKDDNGNLAPSGGYFYSIESAKYGTIVNKMTVVHE